MPTSTSVPTEETPVTSTDTADLLAEVADEMARQDAKWGEQNHPDGTGRPSDDSMARMARNATNHAALSGRLTWRLILAEEVAEAFAEVDPVALREELVQIEAVCAQWRRALDRRRVAATAAALGTGKPTGVTA
jgi:hypothetical protein